MIAQPANHPLLLKRRNKTVSTGAIILLSNWDLGFQELSVFKALLPLIFTFCSFPLAPGKPILNKFAYGI